MATTVPGADHLPMTTSRLTRPERLPVWITLMISIGWLLTVGFAWLVAAAYATDQWGGGLIWATDPVEPFYDDLMLAIHGLAIVAAIAPAIVAIGRRH